MYKRYPTAVSAIYFITRNIPALQSKCLKVPRGCLDQMALKLLTDLFWKYIIFQFTYVKANLYIKMCKSTYKPKNISLPKQILQEDGWT